MKDVEVMNLALVEAVRAERQGDVPIGAVLVCEGLVITSACNERELRNDPTAHAEVLALRTAAEQLGRWRLDDCTLYVTLEPCAMCLGALFHARVSRVVFGAPDPKTGACGGLIDLTEPGVLNHHAAVSGGVLGDECGQTLSDFFKLRRQRAEGWRGTTQTEDTGNDKG